MNMRQQLEYMVQFFHPEKRYGFLRGGNSQNAHAALFGLRESFYQQLKQPFFNRAQAIAEKMCLQEEYYKNINAISLPHKGIIVALGDSLTDDLQSWFEILRRSFEIVRPDDEIKFINMAVSGDTTTQMLGSVVNAATAKADLYICLTGINDARVQGGKNYKPCTSLQEVAKNIDSLMSFASNETNAKWLWIAPPGVLEERIENHEFFKPIRAFWSDKYVSKVADLILERAQHKIDLRPTFSIKKQPDLFDSDGLHWSIDGQQLTATTVASYLANIDLSN